MPRLRGLHQEVPPRGHEIHRPLPLANPLPLPAGQGTLRGDAKVVFFGPCAAKKNEADRHPELLSLAVTFAALDELLQEKDIHLVEEETADIEIQPAEEGRFYSVEGGMNDTLRDGQRDVRYISVSGLENLDRMLSYYYGGRSQRRIFLECLACHGGCVNGPVIPQGFAGLETITETDNLSSFQTSCDRTCPENIHDELKSDPVDVVEPSENDITCALARVGKFSREDELNCGACGYSTCREFAKALLEDKAEEAMCHTYCAGTSSAPATPSSASSRRQSSSLTSISTSANATGTSHGWSR